MYRLVNGVKVKLTAQEQKELKQQWAENEEQAIKTTYAEKRRYPKIGDQLDMLWHAMDSGALSKDNEFYSEIKKVKDNSPKPQ